MTHVEQELASLSLEVSREVVALCSTSSDGSHGRDGGRRRGSEPGGRSADGGFGGAASEGGSAGAGAAAGGAGRAALWNARVLRGRQAPWRRAGAGRCGGHGADGGGG